MTNSYENLQFCGLKCIFIQNIRHFGEKHLNFFGFFSWYIYCTQWNISNNLLNVLSTYNCQMVLYNFKLWNYFSAMRKNAKIEYYARIIKTLSFLQL